MRSLERWPLELEYSLQRNAHLMENFAFVEKTKLAPKEQDVLNAFALTPFDKVKVLIIGQDPYIRGEAHGLAFSSQTSITPSLKIIFKELHNDLEITRINPNLTDWAQQGVLLLNSILTTELGTSLAHEHFGWQDFTSKAIQLVLSRDKPLVVMLWGSYAKGIFDKITSWRDHYPLSKILVLRSNHPAAEARPGSIYHFTGNKHFSQANNWLVKQGLGPIKW